MGASAQARENGGAQGGGGDHCHSCACTEAPWGICRALELGPRRGGAVRAEGVVRGGERAVVRPTSGNQFAALRGLRAAWGAGVAFSRSVQVGQLPCACREYIVSLM